MQRCRVEIELYDIFSFLLNSLMYLCFISLQEMPIFSAYATLRITLWHLPRLEIDTVSELREIESIRKDILPRRVRIFETIDKETGSANVPEYGLNAPGEDVATGGSIYRDYMAYAEQEEAKERAEASLELDQTFIADAPPYAPRGHDIDATSSLTSQSFVPQTMGQPQRFGGTGSEFIPGTTMSQYSSYSAPTAAKPHFPDSLEQPYGESSTAPPPSVTDPSAEPAAGKTTIRRAQYSSGRRQPLGEIVLPVALFSDQRARDMWISLRPCGSKAGYEGKQQILSATDNVFGTRLAELDKVVQKNVPDTVPVKIDTHPVHAQGNIAPVPSTVPPPQSTAPLRPAIEPVTSSRIAPSDAEITVATATAVAPQSGFRSAPDGEYSGQSYQKPRMYSSPTTPSNPLPSIQRYEPSNPTPQSAVYNVPTSQFSNPRTMSASTDLPSGGFYQNSAYYSNRPAMMENLPKRPTGETVWQGQSLDSDPVYPGTVHTSLSSLPQSYGQSTVVQSPWIDQSNHVLSYASTYAPSNTYSYDQPQLAGEVKPHQYDIPYMPFGSQYGGIPTRETALPSVDTRLPPHPNYASSAPTATDAASDFAAMQGFQSVGFPPRSSRAESAEIALSAAANAPTIYPPVWVPSGLADETLRPSVEVPLGSKERGLTRAPFEAEPDLETVSHFRDEVEIDRVGQVEYGIRESTQMDVPRQLNRDHENYFVEGKTVQEKTEGKKVLGENGIISPDDQIGLNTEVASYKGAVSEPTDKPVVVLSDALVHDYGLGRIRIRVAMNYDPISEFWSHFLHSETPASRQRIPFSATFVVHLLYRIYEQIGEPLQKLQKAVVNVINWDDPFLALQTIIFFILWGYWSPLFLVGVQIFLIQKMAKNYVDILLATVHRRLHRRIAPSTLKPAPIVTTAAIVKSVRDEEPVILRYEDTRLSRFLMPWRWKRKVVGPLDTDVVPQSVGQPTAELETQTSNQEPDTSAPTLASVSPRKGRAHGSLSVRSFHERHTRAASIPASGPLSPSAERTGAAFEFLRGLQSAIGTMVMQTYKKLQDLRESAADTGSFAEQAGAQEEFGDLDQSNPAWERLKELLVELGNRILRHAYDVKSSNASFQQTMMTQREAREEMRRRYLKSDEDKIPHLVKRDVPSVRVIVVHRQKRLVITALGDEVTDFSRAIVPGITKDDVQAFAKKPKLLKWRGWFQKSHNVGVFKTLNYPYRSEKDSGKVKNVEEFSEHSSMQLIADLYKSKKNRPERYSSEALRAILESNSMMAPIAQRGSMILNSIREYSMPPVAFVRTALSAREVVQGKPNTTVDQQKRLVPLGADALLKTEDLPKSSTVAGTAVASSEATVPQSVTEQDVSSKHHDLWDSYVRRYFVNVEESSSDSDFGGRESEVAGRVETTKMSRRRRKMHPDFRECLSKPIPIQANTRQVIINSAVVIHDPVVASALFKRSWHALRNRVIAGEADDAERLEYWNYNQEFELPPLPEPKTAEERDLIAACLPAPKGKRHKLFDKIKRIFKHSSDYSAHLPADQTRTSKFTPPKIIRPRKVPNAEKAYGGSIVQTRVVTGHRDLSEHVKQAQRAGHVEAATAIVPPGHGDGSAAAEKIEAKKSLPEVVAHLQNIGFENAYIPEEVANIYIEAIEGMDKENITENILEKKRKNILPPLQQYFEENQDLSSVVTSSLSATSAHDVSLPSGCIILKGERTRGGKSIMEVREEEEKVATEKSKSAIAAILGLDQGEDMTQTLQSSGTLLRVWLTLGSVADRIIPTTGTRVLQQIQNFLADVADVLEVAHHILNFARIKITRRVLFVLCLSTIMTAFSSQRQLILGSIIIGLALHTKPVQHFLNIIRGVVSYTLGSLSNPIPNAVLSKAWILKGGGGISMRASILSEYDVYSEVVGSGVAEEKRIISIV